MQTIFLVGTDSITIETSTALIMLAIHQNVQNKVREEVLKVLGQKNKPITADDLNKMVYLQCFIKETLRRFIPVGALTRTALKNITLG